jgi:hypothetical protein
MFEDFFVVYWFVCLTREWLVVEALIIGGGLNPVQRKLAKVFMGFSRKMEPVHPVSKLP